MEKRAQTPLQEVQRTLRAVSRLTRPEPAHWRLGELFRDAPTRRHVERMSTYCRLLAERLGVGAERAGVVRTASLLHDVGKLVIPNSLLEKPGRLTDDEWREMQRHTTIGHELLAGFGSGLIELAATIALTHHERFDGGGYPDGRAGDEIPLEGRIAAVCDVFDALTCQRPYRVRAFSLEEALSFMRSERGKAFDPEILDAFVGSFEDVKGIRAQFADLDGVLSAA
jgi:putative two-component system response regulator